MGKLCKNRALLGNIALVVFLAFLACFTFGVVTPVPAEAAPTPTEDPNLDVQVDEQHRAAVRDKDGNWVKDGGIAKLITSEDKKSVQFTVQVLTDADFSSIMLHILGVGPLDENGIKDVVYKKIYSAVYKTVYYVYQFVYHWVYQPGLNVASDKDYTLHICSDGALLASITLDLESPPPKPSGGGGGGGGGVTPPTTTTTTDTGTLTSTADGQATLTVDDKKVADLVARADVTQVEFVIPADKAAKQGTVEVAADTLAKVFEAGKSAVVKVGDVQLILPPGAIDLAVFKGQGVTLKITVAKAGVPAAVGDAALKPAGEAFTITIRAEAGGADKGGIATFSKPVTLVLPYDPAKLAGVPEDYLGIYRQSGSSWEYVGGKVDRAAKKVSVERTSLSTYAVMAYDKNFVDMAGHWAEADVKLMAAKHIAAGVTATTFAPDASVTRAQFAAFLLRALNIPEQKAAGARFSDVAADAWYAGAVETAAAQGLVSGYPDGTFKPDALITREEVAAMVTRALAKSGKSVTLSEVEVQALLARFKDAGDIGSWAKQAMAVAVKEGIVKGRLDDQCAPKANATRAEAVVMVKRLLAATGAL